MPPPDAPGSVGGSNVISIISTSQVTIDKEMRLFVAKPCVTYNAIPMMGGKGRLVGMPMKNKYVSRTTEGHVVFHLPDKSHIRGRCAFKKGKKSCGMQTYMKCKTCNLYFCRSDTTHGRACFDNHVKWCSLNKRRYGTGGDEPSSDKNDGDKDDNAFTV